MPLRLIEAAITQGSEERVRELVQDCDVVEVWFVPLDEERVLARIVLPTAKSEKALDILDHNLSHMPGFRLLLTTVEATIPRPEKKAEPEDAGVPAPPREKVSDRLSREELYGDIETTTDLTGSYLVMTVLSSIVAAIGLLKGSVAIIIGAMVIAPLLGPNVAFSFATTLGDTDLAYKSMKTNVAGMLLTLVLAIMLGVVVNVDPAIPEIASRTRVGLGDIGLALAAGAAGTLAFTRGLSGALIGVMVAVALLPPLVTVGLLFGAALWQDALGALLLLLVNLICINLAGVVSFLAQGILPSNWWEAKKAKRATRIAIGIWTVLLVLLAGIIFLAKSG